MFNYRNKHKAKHHTFWTTTKISCIFFFTAVTLTSNLAYSQTTTGEKQALIQYISKDLSISEIKAEQVVTILSQYKTKAKDIVNNQAYSEAERKTKLDLIIDEKNNGLTKLLTPQQLEKVIPSTERRAEKAATNGTK